MKNLFAIIILFLAGTAWAAPRQYEIDMELMVDGKVVSTPKIITMEGTKASIESAGAEGGTFVEVTPSEKTIKGVDGILMEMKVGFVDDTGFRRVLAQPRILAKDGAKAQIILDDKKKNQEVTLKATAKRVSR